MADRAQLQSLNCKYFGFTPASRHDLVKKGVYRTIVRHGFTAYCEPTSYVYGDNIVFFQWNFVFFS